MAIKLEKILDNGYTAEYWRILTIQASQDDLSVSGMVGLYKNAKARRDGSKPIHVELYSFTASALNGNLLSLVYDNLKQKQLNGGEDA
jgi:hypothetical protein